MITAGRVFCFYAAGAHKTAAGISKDLIFFTRTQLSNQIRAMSSLLPDTPSAFINGKWVPSSSGDVFDVTNPANGLQIGTVANCGVTEASAAVDAAHTAFKTWGFDTTAKQRSAILTKLFQLHIDHKTELGKLLTAEQGKPIADAEGEIGYSASFLEWYAAEARRINGEIISPPALGRQVLHFKEPIGVAAFITPWNFPSAMIVRKMAAALAAGCTVVVKPAEDTPLSALALATLAQEAGLPDGVLNVIPADRKNTAAVGQFLCESPKVATISFTGSTQVGKILLKQSADTVKRVSLELGGNAPFIVFDTADLDKAAQGLMNCKFRCSGQTCVCANRVYVQSGVYDAFVGKVKALMEATLKVGDGAQPGITQGPLINNKAVEKVDGLVVDATKKGAHVVLGGHKHSMGGGFYEPTLLTNVTSDMSIATEEIFGPVAAIHKFETESEVLEQANNVRVGLAGYFYSNDIAQIFRVARRMEVGIVGVNEGLVSAPEAAFGGMKESGLGRESSHYGVEEYLEVKYVCLGNL